MSAHDVKMFGDQVAASRLEGKFALMKAGSLLRLAIEDLAGGSVPPEAATALKARVGTLAFPLE